MSSRHVPAGMPDAARAAAWAAIAFSTLVFAYLSMHGARRAGHDHAVLLVRTLGSALCVCVGPIFSGLVLLAVPLRRSAQSAVCVASGTTVCCAGVFAASEVIGLEGSDSVSSVLAVSIAALAVHQAAVVALPVIDLLPNGLDDRNWNDCD